MLTTNARQSLTLTNCPTDSFWFSRWSKGCETRMGYILKQDKAISLDLLKALISSFSNEILNCSQSKTEKLNLVNGLAYTAIMFGGSFRGSEGLKLDLKALIKDFEKGNSDSHKHPHVVIPLQGRFKGEAGEQCHLIPLSNVSASGIRFRDAVTLLVKFRENFTLNNPWGFVNQEGNKLSFSEMNEIFLEGLDHVKDQDTNNSLGLADVDIREQYNINRSFCRGSSTHAQNMNVPEPVINAHNRWRKTEMAKKKGDKTSL